MPSQRTLVCIGVGALAVVIAGAGAAVWIRSERVDPNPAELAIAEPKPPVAPAVPEAPPPIAPSRTAALEPAFDIVNVDPSGEAVIAGRAAPNEKVELRDGGKTVAEATADASGQFVIIPPTLAPGDHSLSLAANTDQGQPAMSGAVAVSVPAQQARAALPAGPPEAKPSVVAANPNAGAVRPGDAHPSDAGARQRRPHCDPVS